LISNDIWKRYSAARLGTSFLGDRLYM